MYDSCNVCSLPMIFSQDTFPFHFDFQDQIGIWLENSFMERYPFHFITHITNYMNGMPYHLILSINFDIILQLRLLTFNAYLIAGLQL